MSDACPIVRIVSDNPSHEGGFIEINESDYNPEIHTLLDAEKPAPAPIKRKTKE